LLALIAFFRLLILGFCVKDYKISCFYVLVTKNDELRSYERKKWLIKIVYKKGLFCTVIYIFMLLCL